MGVCPFTLSIKIGVAGFILYQLMHYLACCWMTTSIALALFLLWWKLADADLTTLFYGLQGVNSKKVQDKWVWIIGASSGIGEELAYAYAQHGARLILSARRQDELERVKKACKGVHTPVVYPFDLLDISAHGVHVQEVLQLSGDGALEHVVLNSGRSQRALAIDTQLEVTRDLFELNFFSIINMTKLVLPHFKSRGTGHFIVTSSVAGKIGAPISSSYSGTKFAINGYFDALRNEVEFQGIHVTTVCPGPVDTPIASKAMTGSRDGAPAPAESGANKMPAARCAYLMLSATTHEVDEVWISPNPVLFFTYLNQYCPTIARYIGKKVAGPSRVHAFQTGQDVYQSSSFFSKLFAKKEENKKAE